MGIDKISHQGETIYLKNNKYFGWKVVYPITNEDGSTNWPNLIYGGNKQLLSTIITIAIIVMLAIGMNSQLAQCRDMAAHPCKYFDCPRLAFDEAKINFSELSSNSPNNLRT